MALASRMRTIFEEEGFFELVRRSILYLRSTIIPMIIWSVLPESKTKRIISKSKILTTVYYGIRGTFYDEQRAILVGQAKYVEDITQRNDPIHAIIRNTHRIEKGLSMRDRRSIFAEGYIQNHTNLVKFHLKNNREEKKLTPQLEWVLDVLDEYFKIVTHTTIISEAHKSYLQMIEDINYNPGNRRPISRSDINYNPNSFENFKELSEGRHSTRWFEDKHVERDIIDDAISLALESPSACNRQSYRFLVFDDPDMIEDLASIPGGAKGYIDNIPCLIILIGRQRAYFHDRDKHVIYIDGSLASMTFQYALESKGLASCCINWQAIPRNQEEIRKRIDLDEDEKVIMFIAVGYPDKDEKVPYSEKKQLSDVRKFNPNKET